MEGKAAEAARHRKERAASDRVLEALRAALRQALVEIADAKGVVGLDEFLDRRLFMVRSLRAPRPWEPPALTAVRERDAAAIEAVLREIVEAARKQWNTRTGPA